MNVLVTGASGRLGSSVVPALRAAGHDVSGAGRSSASEFTLDITGSIDPALFRGFDVVVHLAAIADRRWTPEDQMLRVNRDGAIAVAEAAASAGVPRFLFASTLLVYGDSRTHPITAKTQPAPEDPYSITKLEVEDHLLQMSAAGRLASRVLRLASVRDDGGPTAIAMSIAERAPIVPVPSRDNRRAFVNRTDVSQRIVNGVEGPWCRDFSVEVVSSGHRSFREELVLASRVRGRRLRTVRLPAGVFRAGDRLCRRLRGPSLAGFYADLAVETWSEPTVMPEGLDE